MLERTVLRSLAAALLGMALVVPCTSRAEPRYTLQVLDPPGSTDSNPNSLNELGQVLGTARFPDGTSRAFLYTPAPIGAAQAPPAVLNPSEAISSWGQFLGNGGHAVIGSHTAAGVYSDSLYYGGAYTDLTAAGFSPRGAPTTSGTIPGAIVMYDGAPAAVYQGGAVIQLGDGSRYEATHVNEAGDVVGSVPAPWLYRAGAFTDLPFVRVSSFSDDREGPINDSGLLSGIFLSTAGEERLGTWSAGVLTDRGHVFSGAQTTDDPRGMNARGDIFGNASNYGPLELRHSFLYNAAAGTLQDVGSLGGEMCLHGINDRGELAGHSRLPGNRPYEHHEAGANVVIIGGQVHNLNDLIPPGSGIRLSAYGGAINNRGQILTDCVDQLNVQHTCLLTPAPRTSATLGGLRRADGWFRSNVTVTLTGSDPTYGVREIRYRVDNGAETVVRPASPAASAKATLTVSAAGTHVVTYWSVNAQGHVEAANTTSISIDKASLVITTAALPDATRGAPYAKALTAIQGTTPYRWAALTALPCGLSLSTSGVISGTPTCAGTYSFLIQVTANNLVTSRSYLTLNILSPLTITVPAVTSTTVNPPHGVPLTASGGLPPYRWSISPATPLPSTMALDMASIMSAANDPGASYPLDLIVTDARNVSVTRTVQLDVLDDLVVTGPPYNNDFYAGQPFTLELTASGGRPPYTWSISGQAWPPFPPGITLDPTSGIITGTIDTPNGYWVQTWVVDADGNLSSGSFWIGVSPAP